MREFWADPGVVAAERSRDLSSSALRELLRLWAVRFVVAVLGCRPRWVPEEASFDFWKAEVRPHLADPDLATRLDDFPGGFCYYASEWSPAAGSLIVVLEMAH
ncbi:MAG: hypothetical protein U0800_07090 [Isosphaeraceae bacterium]